MTGIIDVGGGLRGIYAAGIFDRLMEENITFDWLCGVSAGSANIASFAAGQRARNYRFYTEYPFRKEYMGLHSILKCGSVVNLDYVYGELSKADGETPLDYPAFSAFPGQIRVVATCADTGEAVYFSADDVRQDDYTVMMASSCLPVFCRPRKINGRHFYDGALSDPVPIQKAFDDGCDKVVVILTKPIAPKAKDKRDLAGAAMMRFRFPKFAENMRRHNDLYNSEVAFAKECEKEGRALVVCPDDVMGMGTLTKDRDLLDKLYQKGLTDAEKIISFIR